MNLGCSGTTRGIGAGALTTFFCFRLGRSSPGTLEDIEVELVFEGGSSPRSNPPGSSSDIVDDMDA